MNLPLAEIVRLAFDWVDTGEIDPALVEVVCERLEKVAPGQIAEAAESGRDLIAGFTRIPGAVAVARLWIGRNRERLARLAELSPDQVKVALNAVIDRLLERSPEHGAVLFAYRTWAMELVLRVAEILAGKVREARSDNVVNFPTTEG